MILGPQHGVGARNSNSLDRESNSHKHTSGITQTKSEICSGTRDPQFRKCQHEQLRVQNKHKQIGLESHRSVSILANLPVEWVLLVAETRRVARRLAEARVLTRRLGPEAEQEEDDDEAEQDEHEHADGAHGERAAARGQLALRLDGGLRLRLEAEVGRVGLVGRLAEQVDDGVVVGDGGQGRRGPLERAQQVAGRLVELAEHRAGRLLLLVVGGARGRRSSGRRSREQEGLGRAVFRAVVGVEPVVGWQAPVVVLRLGPVVPRGQGLASVRWRVRGPRSSLVGWGGRFAR